ncbi:MAG: ABC transporter substrate-binding protein, partial [Propionibacterium sp.]
SSVRNSLVPVVAGRVPYVYPALYEGGENRSGVYCTGEAPDDYLLPALEWFRDNVGARRWFLIGDDYVWPHRTYRWLRQRAASLGIGVAGSQFVSYGSPDPEGIRAGLEAMDQEHCDGVISLMIGQNAVDFNRAFGQAGLHNRMIRLCPLSDENVLLANGTRANSDLYTVSAYFRTLVTESALDFVGRYQRFHGDGAPVLSGPAESCLESLAALAALVRQAHSSKVRDIDRVVDGTAFTGPRGRLRFKGNQVVQPVYLGRSDGLEFDVVTDIKAS